MSLWNIQILLPRSTQCRTVLEIGSDLAKFSCSKGRPLQTIFAWTDRPVNALQLCRWQYSQKETFFKWNAILNRKQPYCIFESPLGVLWATYDVHLRLIGKHVVDFLLVLTELYPIVVTAEVLRLNMDSKSAFLFEQGQVHGVVPTNHS